MISLSRESKGDVPSSAALIFRERYNMALAGAKRVSAASALLYVRKNLSIAGLLFAWLCANGALLDTVQVFAWGKMFSENARTMDLATAFQATFDPAKACDLCMSVAAAKDTTEKQQPVSTEHTAGEKVLLALHATSRPVFLSSSTDWPAALLSAAPSHIESVPVPPPRA
jgi:hypothetical protein